MFKTKKNPFLKNISLFGQSSLKLIDEKRINESAAALAFYLTLATFPALIALLAILAYLPIQDIEKNLILTITQNIPGNAGEVVIKIIQEVLNEKKPTLLSFGFLTALWLASSGMIALINQLNFSFNTTKRRHYFYKRLVSMGLTLIYVLALVILSVLILLSQRINLLFLDFLGLSEHSKIIFYFFKFGLGFAFLLFSFSSIYYLAPSESQKFRFFSLGGVLGAIAMVIATIGFNYYIANFANYNEIYGSLGGIIIYMFWLYISGFILLVGAEINASYYDKM